MIVKGKRKWIILIAACVLALGIGILGLVTLKRVYANFNHRLDALISQENGIITGYIDKEYVELNISATNKTIEVNTLNTEWEVPIEFVFNNNYSVYFDGEELESGKPLFYKFEEISFNNNIEIKITDKLSKRETTFSLNTLPSDISKFQVIGKGSGNGSYYLSTVNGYGCIYKLSTAGDIEYYKFSRDKRFSDFKKVETPEGITRYIYGEEFQTKSTLDAATTPVQWVIMDEQYHEVERLKMKKSQEIPTDEFPADQHDILFIDDDTYYLMAYVGKNIIDDMGGSKRVIACVIQGFKDGKLAFEWDSTDYPELLSLSMEDGDFPRFSDYTHLNSIDIDKKDGNLLLSFRNLDTICKISTKTGEILWKLGGIGDSFGLTEDQKPSRQHYARYNDNGSITIFDNGNSRGESRVVEYWLDEDNLQLVQFKEYKFGGYYSWATGSAQRLETENDLFVIGWGMKNENSLGKKQPSLSEINFSTGEVNFELFFEDGIEIYRGVKYE